MNSSLKLKLLSATFLTLGLAACGGSDSATSERGAASQPRGAEYRADNEQPTEGEAWEGTTDAERPEVSQAVQAAKGNDFWWPQTLDLAPLRQNASDYSPLGPDFNYREAFLELDLEEVKSDIEALMTESQDWWPADYGHYGPFFIRMAWHSAGTYRLADGRGGAAGGQQRFEPLNSWPDNTNLDKARQLLWPIKKKYGDALSWADLMVLTGNVAMESMGFKTIGFAGGREDDWEPDLVYWGPEGEFLGSKERFAGGELEKPLGASVMGLIYVNPEGPNGSGDPLEAAERIRLTFGRMAMNDEETVALIAGGHTFGKAHGAHKPDDCLSREPAALGTENQGIGWNNSCGKGHSEDTVTSGLEGAWTADPARWTHQYLTFLFEYDWERGESPAGAIQYHPAGGEADSLVPDAHRDDVRHAPMMLTTDLALKEDPAYREISMRFLEDPAEFEDAFARAWFKLTHRDMGPRSNYLGSMVPEGEFIWQDPVPEVSNPISTSDASRLKQEIMASDLTVPQLVRAAWASASSFRESDQRGGTNGARLRFAPQNQWAANSPQEITEVMAVLSDIQQRFNEAGGRQVSMADLLVLGGAAAIEKAAQDAGQDVSVTFRPGRGDATEDMTDGESFVHLEPKADAFRNYYSSEARLTPAQAMVDKADMLGLTIPEMTALIGGMRALGATHGGGEMGVLTDNPGQLTNDFFVNLMDIGTVWEKIGDYTYVGRDRASGEEKWQASEVDLVFGSNAELRAAAERYAYDGGDERLAHDFVRAWTKVMNLGRPQEPSRG
ncbi:catalase/peroxidase HPI [Parvularcula maris]|uniref:Catalase-peroxidase n=1 Tax=Parvularcula maris TaxID=2965077 RepID=A0A9X2L8D1_9PROT|nr:catalase/peroxidase HPI [Parvularcula maris]MCQ8184960.1 catalase/peroxidase HPI [Parvularcula maris]